MIILGSLWPMNWQDRFKLHLEQKGLTQTLLAGRLGITQGALGHWLSGRREINLSAFIQLCRASGANAQHILFGDTPTSTQIVDEIRGLLAAEPTRNSHYRDFEKRLKTVPKPKKSRKANKTRA